MGAPKIKNASNFRNDLFESLRHVSKGETQIITHSGGEPVVLLSKSKYDAILDEQEFLREVAIATEQLKDGKGVSHKQALKRFQKLKARWK